MSTSNDMQLQLIPDDPLRGDMRAININNIPESELHASRRPSASMVQSVNRFGVLTPVLLCPASKEDADMMLNGRKEHAQYKVLAGRRRIMAAREVGHLIINAVIFPFGTTPAQAITLIENEQRSDNPLIELQQIEAIIASHGTIDDICEATGMDKRRAEARMRLANLIKPLRELLVLNQLAVGVAEEAARLTVEQQTRVYDAAQKNGGKVRGKDITDAKRVRAAEATASLPASMFSGAANPADTEKDDGQDENRQVYHATGTIPNGLTVALGQPQAKPKVFPLTIEAAQVIVTFLTGLPYDMETPDSIAAIYGDLQMFLKKNDASVTSRIIQRKATDAESGVIVSELTAVGGQEESAGNPAEAASEKERKPESAARAERRRKAKEQKALDAANDKGEEVPDGRDDLARGRMLEDTPEERTGLDGFGGTDLSEEAEEGVVQGTGDAPNPADLGDSLDPFTE